MKYISIKVIMDRLTRHPLLEDLPLETVVDYAVDFMKIVGAPSSFLEKTAEICIKNYRGELPCDFYKIIQVRLAKPHGHVFRYTTDTFHMSPHKHRPGHTDLTYKLQGNCIFTAPLENGKIEISYKSLAIDEDGYPLIPDDNTYLRALETYIKKQYFTIQFDLGKINQNIMAKADQDYAWAVGQCQERLNTPSLDQMEAISNMWSRLLDINQDHKHGYIHSGTQERVRIH